MSSWDYTNVGASAKPENKEFVEKIFEYIGFAKEPDYAEDGEECSFSDPDVYGCWYSENDSASGDVRACLGWFLERDLVNLLNALFPGTKVYIHKAEGNNTSDTWENHDIVYDTDNMTCYRNDSYTDYGADGPSGKRSSKERFVLKPPKEEHVSALIELSKEDGNIELADLLLDLESKLKDGLIVYEDDGTDHREIGEEYDVVDGVAGDTEDDEEIDIEDAYFDYVIGKMPFKVFVDLYKVKSEELTGEALEDFIRKFKTDPNSFNEEDYRMILKDLIDNTETDCGPFDIEYDDFVDWLEENECKTALDEEGYKKAREKAEELSIVSMDEFRCQ